MSGRNLGSFEAVLVEGNKPLGKTVTAAEAIGWDHAAHGQAVFTPKGDCGALSLLLSEMPTVSSAVLKHVAALLDIMGGDQEEALLRLHLLVNLQQENLEGLAAETVINSKIHVFRGEDRDELEKDAALELFAAGWPELYAAWEAHPLEGLWFSEDDFLEANTTARDLVKLESGFALVAELQGPGVITRFRVKLVA